MNFKEFVENNIITVYFLIGIQGSGKSTWVKNNIKQDYKIVNYDSYRQNLQDKKRKNNPDWTFCHTDNKSQQQIISKGYQEIDHAIKNNIHIILDNMNIIKKYRKETIQKINEIANKYNKKIKLIAVYFKPNVEESIKRIKKARKQGDINFVSDEIIIKCANNTTPPSSDEGFEQIININY